MVNNNRRRKVRLNFVYEKIYPKLNKNGNK